MKNKKEEKEMISIPASEYEDLKEDQRLLDCLRGAGVDNWEGYSEAVALFEDEGDADNDE